MTTVKEIGTVPEDVLKTLDFAIAIDTSGSTELPSHRLKGKTRLQEIREECQRICAAAARFDDDGLTLVQFAGGATVFDGVTPDRVDQVFAKIRSGGSTNLGAALRKFTDKAVASEKPFVGFVFTDGEASDQEDVIKALSEAATKTKGRPKFGVVILQTGNAPEATAYLRKLDDEMGSRGIPDMVSVVTEDESEGLGFEQLVWLAQNA